MSFPTALQLVPTQPVSSRLPTAPNPAFAGFQPAFFQLDFQLASKQLPTAQELPSNRVRFQPYYYVINAAAWGRGRPLNKKAGRP